MLFILRVCFLFLIWNRLFRDLLSLFINNIWNLLLALQLMFFHQALRVCKSATLTVNLLVVTIIFNMVHIFRNDKGQSTLITGNGALLLFRHSHLWQIIIAHSNSILWILRNLGFYIKRIYYCIPNYPKGA